jgi:glutamate-1-semialdehyde 2,1-aminomutase
MEVQRNLKPNLKFLKEVRKITKKEKIILIFDECTSGFRESFGGIHLKYKIFPDMLMLGKAIGNGYPITAVLGKKEIMEKAQDTFISSTMWTDRIGPSAALETLREMEKNKSWETITKSGLQIKKFWKKIFFKYNFKVKIGGINAIPNFVFTKNHLELKTLITQEMLKRKILASNMIFLSQEHKKKHLNIYMKNFSEVMQFLSKELKKKSFSELLEQPICHGDFKRLN